MKTLFCLLFIFLLTSCQRDHVKREAIICNCKEKRKLEEFIKSSIKDANNMSDEEMEDVIRELGYTGTEIYCHKEFIWFDIVEGHLIPDVSEKFDSCRTFMR